MSAFLAAVFTFSVAGFATAQENPLLADSQSVASNLPRFEVAAVKPGKSQPPFVVGLEHYPSGRVVVTNFTLENLLMFALDVAPFQIEGGPAWINSERYVIEAEAPPSASGVMHSTDPRSPLTSQQKRMLLALLIDRFQLKYHVATREGGVFLLERGKGELGLEPPKNPASHPWVHTYRGSTGLAGGNITMAELAQRLSGFLRRPVRDKTGITGSFDFAVKTSDYDPNAKYTLEDSDSSILSAVEKIGLKLKSAKGPVQTVIIDHAEQPSPN